MGIQVSIHNSQQTHHSKEETIQSHAHGPDVQRLHGSFIREEKHYHQNRVPVTHFQLTPKTRALLQNDKMEVLYRYL